MAGKMLNNKVFNPLKLRSGTGILHICHYLYNLPLPPSAKFRRTKLDTYDQYQAFDQLIQI